MPISKFCYTCVILLETAAALVSNMAHRSTVISNCYFKVISKRLTIQFGSLAKCILTVSNQSVVYYTAQGKGSEEIDQAKTHEETNIY